MDSAKVAKVLAAIAFVAAATAVYMYSQMKKAKDAGRSSDADAHKKHIMVAVGVAAISAFFYYQQQQAATLQQSYLDLDM